ncbi:nidogen-like domain-containing protein [Pseudooceanicola onchidii]|uniref:nidogen-like domain-containing protein n=1 Tax=Pseudooceanicola onchidii TaxID=2562279 RepID=UPI0010AA2A78|nr:nidogen-like domain-containing protein [Pseudooceanicola onchidii]
MAGSVQRGLGGASGFGELALPRSDDGAFRIAAGAVFANGLNVFGTTYSGDDIWIGTNGVMSFGTGAEAVPSSDGVDPSLDILAPFWADVDTRLNGEGIESGPIWVDMQGGVLTVTWEDVGRFRRSSDPSNLFQMQLTDRGNGDFDLRFTYERIEWVQSTHETEVGAQMILSSARLPEPWIEAGEALTLDTRTGNTGITGRWLFEMRDGALPGLTPVTGDARIGGDSNDTLSGGAADDILRGGNGNDILRGFADADWLFGGDGADTLNAASGDDHVMGGNTDADLRDVIYGGAGQDYLDGGHGNDLIYGGDGQDTLEGGFGVDQLIGQQGDDALSGAAWSDEIFGGDGADFLNGGFGFDRLNGGTGADRFFHLGIADHGSDWVQDYSAVEGDLLVWGQGANLPGNFQVNWADTAGAGQSGVAEAFVIYKPTGQILWALVDGAAQPQINLMMAGVVHDLL